MLNHQQDVDDKRHHSLLTKKKKKHLPKQPATKSVPPVNEKKKTSSATTSIRSCHCLLPCLRGHEYDGLCASLRLQSCSRVLMRPRQPGARQVHSVATTAPSPILCGAGYAYDISSPERISLREKKHTRLSSACSLPAATCGKNAGGAAGVVHVSQGRVTRVSMRKYIWACSHGISVQVFR